ncbi:MAG TPA: MATE family efflux transporter [Candidatus Baltobacteraceae bacterium]|nr:MATE family efflux transporter [Candidatus Baltobacteraceae bacterium]
MGRQILVYALPLAAAQTLQLAAGTAALAVLGQLGPDTLGAVAAPITLMTLAASLFAPFATGAMVGVARARASEDPGRVHRLTSQSLAVALAAGVAGGSLWALFTPELLHATNVPPALLDIAIPYTQLLAVSLPGFFVFTMYASLLEAMGRTGAALAMLGASTAIFLTGLLTLRIGAFAVPISSLAATLLVTIGAAILLYVRYPEFRFDVHPSRFIPNPKTAFAALRFDAAVNTQFIAVALSDVAIVSVAYGYGAHGAAAFVIVLQVLAYVSAPAVIFATTVSASQRGVRAALAMQLVAAGAACILAYVFAPAFLRAFSVDPQTLSAARAGVFTVAWSVVALGIGNFVSAEADACEEGLWPAAIAVGGVWLILVPCARAFSMRWGMDGIWDAYALAYAAIAVLQIGAAPLLLRRPHVREVKPVPDRTIF